MAGPGNFQVRADRVGSALVVTPQGEIDLASVGTLRDAIESEHDGKETLVVDLRGVSFMDTSGLRYLLTLTQDSAGNGFALRIVRGPRAVQRVFEVSGLQSHLPFVDDPAQDPPGG